MTSGISGTKLEEEQLESLAVASGEEKEAISKDDRHLNGWLLLHSFPVHDALAGAEGGFLLAGQCRLSFPPIR
jgi:hypothetical protein